MLTCRTNYQYCLYPWMNSIYFLIWLLPIVCQQNNIPIGIITTPAQYAQDVCDQLVAAGCKAIWNFAHVHLYVPEGTLVQNEDMAVSFALLSNRLAKTMRTGPEEA